MLLFPAPAGCSVLTSRDAWHTGDRRRRSWCCVGRRRASGRGNTASETGSSRRACARSGGRRGDERNHHSARNYSIGLLDEALRYDAELARWSFWFTPQWLLGLRRSTSEREPSRLT